MHILRKNLAYLLIFLCIPAYAAINNLSEEDGSPSIYPWKVKVTNGTLTDNGDGSASLVTGVDTSGFTASEIVATDASKNLQTLTTATYPSLTELSYVKGVTSALQTQIDGKQATGNYITALTGDGTASGPGSVALTLATVNSNVGSFGSATKSLTATVNAKGLVTAMSEQTVTPAVGSITGLGTGVATWLATPSSANLASAITDETGSGALVFGTSPTFTTQLTSPIVIGGSTTTSTLKLQTTSASSSTTGADILFLTGNNGATENARLLNSGNFGLGTATPGTNVITTPGSGYTSRALHILNDSGAAYLLVEGNSATTTGLVFVNRANSTNKKWFELRNAGSRATVGWILDNGSNYNGQQHQMCWEAAGNVKMGNTLTRGTTEGSGQLVLFNAPTEPVGTLTNGLSLYSSSGGLKVMNSAGDIATMFSGSDTIVGKATTDTLTNKTLTAAIVATKITASSGATIGSTTAADKFGSTYLTDSADIFPDNDAYGLFNRYVNYGFTPFEHWGQGSDEQTWTGYAAYTGYVTPAIISRTRSALLLAHDAGSKNSFYYRSASTGANIYLRARVAITYLCSGGIMIDDGTDAGDGKGANNYVKVYIKQSALSGAMVVYEEYRTGGGAATTNTGPTIPYGQFIGLQIHTSGTLWTNWSALTSVFGESQIINRMTAGISGLTWTPSRVGLYGEWTAADGNRKAIFDWYNESTS